MDTKGGEPVIAGRTLRTQGERVASPARACGSAALNRVLRCGRLGLAALLAICWLGGCKQPPQSSHHPLSERAAAHSLASITGKVVQGSLRGKAFEASHAYVRSVTMEGRERVDLLLSETPIDHCGIPMTRAGRRVWLRIPGSPTLDGDPMRLEVDQKDAGLSTHYELHTPEGWLSHGGGAALLSLVDDGFGRYHGALWSCFDDGQESCVSGQFQAVACRSELDVDDSVWGAARMDPDRPTKPR